MSETRVSSCYADIKMQIEKSTSSVMIYLIACALHNEKPEESILTGAELHRLYSLSKAHALSALVYMVLQDTKVFQDADPALKKQWKESEEKVIRKNILLDAERKQILSEMEKRHIWYMPLKGSVLKYLYPREGMREMADNDILYDRQFQNEVKDILTARGYQIISFGKSTHDTYRKMPIYNYEMHTSLFRSLSYPKFALYYDHIQNNLLPDADTQYGRHFSCEDFYVYMTAHAYKHYKCAGTGIRTLADEYVMIQKYREQLDWGYVEEQLSHMEIEEFERTCRSLAEHLFGKAEPIDLSALPSEEQMIIRRCFSSGTYGTTEHRLQWKLKSFSKNGTTIKNTEKAKYYMHRLFPGRKWCKEFYPFLYRFPVFIPFLWVYRTIRALLFKKKQIKNEITMVQRISDIGD